MNKAFIFDMDGVIINSESIWERYESIFLPGLIGENIYTKIKDEMLGNSVDGIYNAASACGAQLSKDKFIKTYDNYAKLVYKEAEITTGIEILIKKLKEQNFKIGLVSSSRKNWINLVLKKLKTKNHFQYVLSLGNGTVKPKPYPDGYLKAIAILGSAPNKTAILEDSQKGVIAAKESGAYTICITEHLPSFYIPKGADRYIRTVAELLNNFDI